jgi:purine-nucleoside phosphorylase
MERSSFDEAVFDAAGELRERGVIAPHALMHLGTGLGVLPGRLEDGRRIPLDRAEGVPAAWSGALLHYGHFNGLPVWMLEDAPGDPDPGDPPWAEAFPIWLAAAAGASTLVHSSAGSALDRGKDSVELGSIALLADHLNLSGTTPLVGLGETRLGPMFPDQTQLHDERLRSVALRLCKRLGLAGTEVVGACTPGPALETPAERRWFARAGAHVSVQRLAPTLLAAAHAGLGTLAIVLVVSEGDEAIDIARVSAVASELAPALDDLLWELSGTVQADALADLANLEGEDE